MLLSSELMKRCLSTSGDWCSSMETGGGIRDLVISLKVHVVHVEWKGSPTSCSQPKLRWWSQPRSRSPSVVIPISLSL